MSARNQGVGTDSAEAKTSDSSAQPASVEPNPKTRERRACRRRNSGRLLDLREAELYSGISAWTLRDLIASGDLPVVRPPRLRRVWIDRADLDKAIADWKDRTR